MFSIQIQAEVSIFDFKKRVSYSKTILDPSNTVSPGSVTYRTRGDFFVLILWPVIS